MKAGTIQVIDMFAERGDFDHYHLPKVQDIHQPQWLKADQKLVSTCTCICMSACMYVYLYACTYVLLPANKANHPPINCSHIGIGQSSDCQLTEWCVRGCCIRPNWPIEWIPGLSRFLSSSPLSSLTPSPWIGKVGRWGMIMIDRGGARGAKGSKRQTGSD